MGRASRRKLRQRRELIDANDDSKQFREQGAEQWFIRQHQQQLAAAAWEAHLHYCEPVLLVLQANRFQERVGVKLQAIPWSKLIGEPGFEAVGSYDPNTELALTIYNPARSVNDVFTLRPTKTPPECYEQIIPHWEQFVGWTPLALAN